MMFAAVALLFQLATGTLIQGPVQHDIVVVLSDDQPWHTQQFMPLTNRLIGDAGIVFKTAYDSTPLCCPSRANVLTGRYSHRHGVLANHLPVGGAPAFDETRTVAVALQAAGYRTGIFGKYLNSYELLTPWPYVAQGWSKWFVFADESRASYYDYDVVNDGVQVHYDSSAANYSTDVLANEAVRFIESTPPSRRLFVYFAPAAPHGPATPAPRDVGTFGTLPPYQPPNFNEPDVSDKPLWVRRLAPAADAKASLYRKQVESLQAVDRAVKKIVNALTRTGRMTNTAIIYTTDNGFSYASHRWVGKGCVYEECSKVPFLLRAPDVSPRTEAFPVATVDIAPTVADWAGIVLPWPVDGMSLGRFALKPEAQPARHGVLLESLMGTSTRAFQALHTARYVYGEYENGDREFYDLMSDPYQLVNAVGDIRYASQIAGLQKRLGNIRPDVDISLSMTADPASPAPGDTVQYRAQVTNNGPHRAVVVKVYDDFPANLKRVSCSATGRGQCAGSPDRELVVFVSLAAGASAEIQIRARVAPGTRSGTVIRNTAQAVSLASEDRVAGNNAATVSVTIR